MPVQEITIKVDVPDGWEFDRVGKAKNGERFLQNGIDQPSVAICDWTNGSVAGIILRRIEPDEVKLARLVKSAWRWDQAVTIADKVIAEWEASK